VPDFLPGTFQSQRNSQGRPHAQYRCFLRAPQMMTWEPSMFRCSHTEQAPLLLQNFFHFRRGIVFGDALEARTFASVVDAVLRLLLALRAPEGGGDGGAGEVLGHAMNRRSAGSICRKVSFAASQPTRQNPSELGQPRVSQRFNSNAIAVAQG
jgi:hypothetical protein